MGLFNNKEQREKKRDQKYQIDLTKAENTQVTKTKDLGSWLPSVLGFAGTLTNSLLNKGNSKSTLSEQELFAIQQMENDKKEAQRKQTQMIIIIGIVLAIAIIVTIIFLKKKKNGKS